MPTQIYEILNYAGHSLTQHHPFHTVDIQTRNILGAFSSGVDLTRWEFVVGFIFII